MRGLLAGDIRFTRLALYQPRLTLERLPGQERFNIMRIFTGDDEPEAPEPGLPDSLAPLEGTETTEEPQSTQVVFRRIDFHNGSVDVIYPLGPGPAPKRGLVETLRHEIPS